jgi:hypothetical protein
LSKGRIFYIIFFNDILSANVVARNTMRSWALFLDLNGRVENAEIITPAEFVDISYYLIVQLRSYVAGKDIFATGQSPAMEIVNFFDGVEF